MKCSTLFRSLAALGMFSLPLLATTATSGPAINDVVNAANRIPSGFPSAGIAQGALFAVMGTDLGADPLQQAAFPLPSTGGFAGVNVQAQVGGATVDCIMVYVSSTEVGAIMPSGTPLGSGTITVTNSAGSASAPITVVAAAFGAFSLDYFSGKQAAAAYNVNGDGSLTLNYLGAPGATAQTGQTVMIGGTGLGAISSDETQSGVTDVPNVNFTVWVGTQQAVVVSAGRGTFPGLPGGFPVSPVPMGTAAVDVIQFIVPAGITGCEVPVVVQIGNFVSNFIWIAISPDGSPCVDLNAADFGATAALSGTARTGLIALQRITDHINYPGGFTVANGSEIATAQFIQYGVPNPVTVNVSEFAFEELANNLDPGTCLVLTSRIVIPPPSPGTISVPRTSSRVVRRSSKSSSSSQGPTFLDAGPALNLNNSAGATEVVSEGDIGVYSAGIGSFFSFTGTPPQNTLFLIPGLITLDNGGGGADVPAFSSSLTLPDPPLVFANIDAVGGNLDRTQGVTVQWTGGDPNSYVNIVGTSINATGNVTLTGTFSCSAPVSAGQFYVPDFVTRSMPLTANNPPLPPTGVLSIWNYAIVPITIPSMDVALFSVVLETQTGVLFQ
jgi:uncharacterized protein (TIGR03437 family)